MPLSKLGQSRSTRENLVLAFALATVAGIVNVIGLIELGVFTSNMSGTSTRLGESFGRADHELMLTSAIILGGFSGGAMLATLFVERAKLHQRARYVVALLLEAFLLATVAVTTELVDVRPLGLHRALIAALCVAMGLQNALVTHISGAVVRTTHVTGIVTDFSIELVQLGFAFRERLKRYGSLGLRKVLVSMAEVPDFYRARLHLTIFLSFVSGGAVGAALYLHAGRIAMVVPVLILIALVIYDQWLQTQWRKLLGSLKNVPWPEPGKLFADERPPKAERRSA